MAEWLGATRVNTVKYIKGAIDATMRERKLFAMLNDRGLITTGQSGTGFQWQVEYLENELRGFDDSTVIDFSRVNRIQQATLPWRGYSMGESMTKREVAMNRGAEALVKVYTNRLMSMTKNIKNQLGKEIYVDGNAAGNGTRFHGLDSFSATTGTQTAAPVGIPDDSYAGLNTDLADQGGTWSDTTAWPVGTGTSNYDYWSPIVVDYTSTNTSANRGWSASTKTWQNTCLEALRFGITHAKRNDDASKQMDIIFVDKDMYRHVKDLLSTEERVNITHKEGSSGLIRLGFQDVVNYDGTDITSEFDTTAGRGYGIPMGSVELLSLYDDLIESDGPILDEATQSFRWALTIAANLKFESIRNNVFWRALT